MMPPPRKHLRALAPVTHGSISEEELAAYGLRREDVIDFSASLNPLGPSPRAVAAARAADIARYPEDGAPVLRRALAEQDGVGVENVLVGNGSSELLWLLAFAYLRAGQLTLTVSPTYGEYARAFRAAGGRVESLSTWEGEGFSFDPYTLARLIKERRPVITAIGSPHNPTGQVAAASDIRSLALAHAEGMLLVDQAYLPFAPEAPDLSNAILGVPLVLLRSLTKLHGLAGLRLGYVVARADVIDALDRLRPPWTSTPWRRRRDWRRWPMSSTSGAASRRYARHTSILPVASRRWACRRFRAPPTFCSFAWATPPQSGATSWAADSVCATAHRSACPPTSGSASDAGRTASGCFRRWRRSAPPFGGVERPEGGTLRARRARRRLQAAGHGSSPPFEDAIDVCQFRRCDASPYWRGQRAPRRSRPRSRVPLRAS